MSSPTSGLRLGTGRLAATVTASSVPDRGLNRAQPSASTGTVCRADPTATVSRMGRLANVPGATNQRIAEIRRLPCQRNRSRGCASLGAAIQVVPGSLSKTACGRAAGSRVQLEDAVTTGTPAGVSSRSAAVPARGRAVPVTR